MNRILAACLMIAATALLAVTLFDATALTLALGLPVERGEAIVALLALSLAGLMLVLASLSLRRGRSLVR